jgi:hypothetical protein
MKNSFLLTHYIKDVPSLNGWKRLMFITVQDGKFYDGFTNREIQPEKIAEEESFGLIFKLPIAYPITIDQCVWIQIKL